MGPTSGRAGSNEKPRVSIVLPAFEGGRTIRWTLESLAAQDFAETEWIIVDDGSRDALPAVVREFLDATGRDATVIQHPENQGLSRTLNDGVRHAMGDLVLILHQDIELVGSDWITRAVSLLSTEPEASVVTGYYGLPAPDDLTFPHRAFGFLRRQFHPAPPDAREFVPFSEFKCDLIRKSALVRLGGFPTEFRVAGEDIMLSYRIRREGGKILKAYDLRAIQRFAGQGETIRGNLRKEFRFGQAFAGVLRRFGGYSFRELGLSRYARQRSIHRAYQPIWALAMVVLLLLALIPGWTVAAVLAGLVLLARYAYYLGRLWPDFHRWVHPWPRALKETAFAALFGLVSDFVYSLGLATGLARTAVGAPL
jgi:GT2 family glycosyltransferase